MKLTQLLNDTSLFVFAACAGLTLAACEKMEPAPESAIVLQSAGSYTAGETRYPEATLLIHQEMGRLWAEIARRETSYECPNGVPTPPSQDDIAKCKAVHTSVPAATAEFDASSLQDILDEARGDLQAELSGATLRVGQPCSVEKPLTNMGGLGGVNAKQGSFKFEGTRWVLYNSGLLERGLEGRVQLMFKDADGKGTGLFEGMITRQRAGRDHSRIFSGGPIAIGTSTRGHVEGAMSLGGTALGSHAPDSTHGNPASIALALPYGAGKIEVQGEKRIFDFNPKTDVTYPNGRGVIKMLTQSKESIEVEDRFQGHIVVPHVDFGLDFWNDDVTGSGSGDFDYALSIVVTQSKVLVVTQVGLSASLTTSDGKSIAFRNDLRADGTTPQVNTELDW